MSEMLMTSSIRRSLFTQVIQATTFALHSALMSQVRHAFAISLHEFFDLRQTEWLLSWPCAETRRAVLRILTKEAATSSDLVPARLCITGRRRKPVIAFPQQPVDDAEYERGASERGIDLLTTQSTRHAARQDQVSVRGQDLD